MPNVQMTEINVDTRLFWFLAFEYNATVRYRGPSNQAYIELTNAANASLRLIED